MKGLRVLSYIRWSVICIENALLHRVVMCIEGARYYMGGHGSLLHTLLGFIPQEKLMKVYHEKYMKMYEKS